MNGRGQRAGARAGVHITFIVAALVGCTDVTGGPDVPFALEFDSIPFPALLAGDTMRDSLGTAAPLRGLAFNGRGDIIAAASIEYFVLDTGASVTSTGLLTTTRRDGSVRVVAVAGNLQSPTRTIRIARSPDSLARDGDGRIAVTYILPDASTNLGPDLRVRLRTNDTTGGLSGNVPGWIVRWRVVHAGDTLAPGDTTLVALQGSSGRRSVRDTTSLEGTSTRRLRVFADRLTSSVDSFLVVAEVRRHGTLVKGSPTTFVVRVSPTP